MLIFWILGILFVAAFTQSLTGFGLALVSMPLLVSVTGLKMATPLVALISVLVEVVLLWRYFGQLRLNEVANLIAASLLGIPAGIFFLRQVDEHLTLFLLGLVLAGYGLYALLGLHLPSFGGKRWAWLFGFLAGALGGAYNTSGPPVILYGHARRWPLPRFKANLQGFFLVSSGMVLVGHVIAGNITVQILKYAFYSIPAMSLGLFFGSRMDNVLSPERFRQLVLFALIVLGIRLMI